MKEIKKKLSEKIRELGLTLNDTVLIHCNVSRLGSSPSEACENLYSSIRNVIGTKGHLFVPAFFYEYAREKKPFDVKETAPSRELGLFPSWFFENKKWSRSYNPITSLMAEGPKIQVLEQVPGGSAYGPGSGFDLFYRLKGKILFVGTGLKDMTFVHYIESKFQTPHLYPKVFNTPVFRYGKPQFYSIYGLVRYLEPEVELDQEGNYEKLKKYRLVKSSHFNNIEMHLVDSRLAVKRLESALKGNPYFFLKKAPDFIEGQYPCR